MGILIYALGLIVIVCIVIPLLSRLLSCDQDSFGTINPTTHSEYMSLMIMKLLETNRDDGEDFEQYLAALKRKGVVDPRIDLKFYNEASKAYLQGTLTRDYIINRLNLGI